MIKFTCPACAQDIEAPDEILLEDEVYCPTCQHKFKPEKVFTEKQSPLIAQNKGEPAKISPSVKSEPRFMPNPRPLIIASIGMIIIVVVALIWNHAQRVAMFDFDGTFNYFSKDDDRYSAAVYKITDELVSPSTAKFDDGCYKSGEGDFIYVRIGVDSQTIYGGMVRSDWGVKMHQTREGTNVWWSADDIVKLSGPREVLK